MSVVVRDHREQTVVEAEMHEAEDTSDDGTMLGIAGDVVEDFVDQCVPGSVVLIIVLIVMFREVTGFWLRLRGKS